MISACPLTPLAALALSRASLQRTDQHADRTQDARAFPDHGGGNSLKWLVKEGDKVVSGDILAEIETDKATMEFEAVDEGTVARILVPEGSGGVKVGAPIAILAGEGEDASAAPPPNADTAPLVAPKLVSEPKADATPKAPRRLRPQSILPQPHRDRRRPRPGRRAIGSRLRRSPGAWPRRKMSIFRPFRAAVLAADRARGYRRRSR